MNILDLGSGTGGLLNIFRIKGTLFMELNLIISILSIQKNFKKHRKQKILRIINTKKLF